MTRHLSFELQQTDWHLMILHYLGLDHVGNIFLFAWLFVFKIVGLVISLNFSTQGHIEGPFAPVSIKRKLHEMDQVIRRIYSSLNKNDLLVILSDHGMANEGGHGGSSQMETLTPAIFVSKSKNRQQIDLSLESIKIHQQIDLASTLSCLFNLPIPVQNRGFTFVNDLTSYLEPLNNNSTNIIFQVKAFKCLNENFKQLDDLLKLVDQDADLETNIKNIHDNFINILNTDQADFKLLKEYNLKIEKLIRERLNKEKDTNAINKKQAYILLLAIAMMLTVIDFFNNSI